MPTLSNFEVFEEEIRTVSRYKFKHNIVNRTEFYKAAWWDLNNKQYLKYISDRTESIGTRSRKIYGFSQVTKDFIMAERRNDIQSRWKSSRERIQSKHRIHSLNMDADAKLRKARAEFSRAQQHRSKIKKGYTTAKIDHNLKTHTQTKTQIRTENISQKSQRIERKKAGKNHLSKNIDVSTQSNKSLHLIKGTKASKTLHKLAGSRTVRRGAIGLGLMFAASKVYSSITSLGNPTVIPEHYDRAYDKINDALTDFGSPVKLWKTASKTITPYKSSVRRGTRTTVRQELEGNVALKLADNAIGHMKY